MSAQPPMERISDGSENSPAPAPVASPAPTSVSDILQSIRETPPAPEPVAQPVVETPLAPPVDAAPVAAPPVTPLAAEPAPVVEPEPTIPSPESRLAPLFELGTGDDAVRSAAEIITKLRYDDPVTAENLLNGVFFAHEKTIQAWTLERLGIPQEKVGEFKAWVESGQALPQPQALPPFPVPGADGHVKIGDVELDLSVDADGRLNYPGDKLAYENAKRLYEIDAREQGRINQENAAKAADRAREEERVIAFNDECYDGASTIYMDERQGVIDSLLNPAIQNLAPEDQIFGNMFKAYVEQEIKAGKEVSKIGLQAHEHLVAVIGDTISRCQRAGYTPAQIKEACNARIKDGRMVDFAAQQDKILRAEINKLKTEFVNQITRRNRAEIAATATAPVIPENVAPVVVNTPPLDNGQPQSFDEIIRRAREYDRQVAAAQRQ